MKQIGKKVLAITLVTAMVLQVVTGLIPTAKHVKAETSEPNYLDVAYDFTEMTDDELNSSELTAAKYQGSRSGSPKTRWIDGVNVQAGELWNIGNGRLLPDVTQYVKLHVAEERDTFQFKFEATAGTGYGYGIDIGVTDRFGYGDAADSAVFGFIVDPQNTIEIHGFADNSIQANDKISSKPSSAGTMKTTVAIPTDVVTKWTVTKNGNTVVVSEEVTGIEFSVTLHSEHQTGMISLNATGSGRLFSRASVDVPVVVPEEPDAEGTYTFTKKMYQNNLEASGITADRYQVAGLSGDQMSRPKQTGENETADDLWVVSEDKGLTPKDTAVRKFLKAHIAEEREAFELKFEAYGSYYGFSIGTTDFMGNNNEAPQDPYTAEINVSGNNIELSGVDEDTLDIISNGEYNSADGGFVKATNDISTDLAKWCVTVFGMDITVKEETSGVEFSVRMNAEHQAGKISLRTTVPVNASAGFYSASVTYQEVDSNLIMFDNLDLSSLEGWTSRIYDKSTGDVTSTNDITDQWFTGEGYDDNVEDWNENFNPRNNPGLKPRVLSDESTPYILTNSVKDYENFEAYFTYYQNSVNYSMIIGGDKEYPTTIGDSAVSVFIHGTLDSNNNRIYELRVAGAIDLDSAVVTGGEGKILTLEDTARLSLNEYGFKPDGASAYKTVTINVKVENGVLTAWVEGIDAAIQVNLASTYVHGDMSLVSTGSAHGGFKYLYVNELGAASIPANGTVSYDMTSKNEYAVITVGTEDKYSSLNADVQFDNTKYEYVKATFASDNGRMSEVTPGEDSVNINVYTNQNDTYVDLYFKTTDGTLAQDFSDFEVMSATMKVVGGKNVDSYAGKLALEHDYFEDMFMNVADLVSTDNADNRAALRGVLVGKDTVSPLFGKTALLLGDSISNAVVDHNGWYGRLSTKYGMDCEEVAQDGWALATKESTGRSRIIDEFQYAEKDNYDVVILEGGVNDVLILQADNDYTVDWGNAEDTEYNTATIAGALHELIETTRDTYPNAQIIYIVNSEFSATDENMTKYVELVTKVCDIQGIPYVNLSDYATYPDLEVINNKAHANHGDYMKDNVHPNGKSYELTTPYIADKLQEVLLSNQPKAYVYVDAELGSDINDGSKQAPFKTMSYATKRVENNGTIEVVGNYIFTEAEASLGNASKAINVTGGALDIRNVNEFNLNGDVTLKEITFYANDFEGDDTKSGASIYANGHRFVIKETVDFAGTVQRNLYGGSPRKAVDSTYMVLNSGAFYTVVGGCVGAEVNNDVQIFIGENFNKGINTNQTMHELSEVYKIYGGSSRHDVMGNVEIVIDGTNAVVGTVYGGCIGAGTGVKKTATITLKKGTVYGIYGGGQSSEGYTNTSTKVFVEGGTVAQIFGGALGASMKASTYVEIKGGTVTRRIYGGCYNEYKLLEGWQSNFFVEGTTTVILHDEATYGTDDLDNAICASSRCQNNESTENATLNIETEALHNTLDSRLKVMESGVVGYDSLIVEDQQQ